MKNTDRRQNKSLKTSVSFSTSLNIIIVIARCIVEIKENFKNMLFFENGTGKLCICSNSPDSRIGIPRILFCRERKNHASFLNSTSGYLEASSASTTTGFFKTGFYSFSFGLKFSPPDHDRRSTKVRKNEQ